MEEGDCEEGEMEKGGFMMEMCMERERLVRERRSERKKTGEIGEGLESENGSERGRR